MNGVNDLLNQFDNEKDCIYILEYNGIPSGCAAITHLDEVSAKFRFFFVDTELLFVVPPCCLIAI
jgi:hypothetical protein